MKVRSHSVLVPCGILGYGIPEESFQNGMKRGPSALAADAGSTDPGPYYLGAGESFTDRGMVKRDLTIMLRAAYEHQIPVVIGSAGGCGTGNQLRDMLEMVEEINAEHGLSFPTAAIPADIDKEILKTRIEEGRVSRLETDSELTADEVDRATNIVAQMGAEPIVKALEHAQVVICGRASDASVVAAPAIAGGMPESLALHMGKILECGAAAAEPKRGTDGIIGTVYEDHFLVEPTNELQICSTKSVATHSLYERSHPLYSSWPGGQLDLAGVRFEQFNERTVKVHGAKFNRSSEYMVKIEGAASIGYRTITIGGIRDPQLLANFDTYEANVRQRVAEMVAPLQDGVDYRIHFHVYGRDGVMGASEPMPEIDGHEVGLLVDVVANRPEDSRKVLALTRSGILHAGYPGRKATAGNVAFPFSPSDVPMGEAYEFNIYHLLALDSPHEFFPVYFGTRAGELAEKLSGQVLQGV